MSDVVPGDLVAVTEEGLKTDLTPVSLMKNEGWPNEFRVRQVLEDETRGTMYVLDPCCNWLVNWKKKEYPFRCTAHPAKHFKKVEGKYVETDKGERFVAIGLGNRDFISVAPAAQGKSARVMLSIPGLPTVAIDGTEIKNAYEKMTGKES